MRMDGKVEFVVAICFSTFSRREGSVVFLSRMAWKTVMVMARVEVV